MELMSSLMHGTVFTRYLLPELYAATTATEVRFKPGRSLKWRLSIILRSKHLHRIIRQSSVKVIKNKVPQKEILP